jgi:hypothetical protein
MMTATSSPLIGGRRVKSFGRGDGSGEGGPVRVRGWRVAALGPLSGPCGGDSVLVELEQVVGHRC